MGRNLGGQQNETADGRRASSWVKQALVQAGIRPPLDYPLGMRFGRFFLLGSYVDNGTALVDLTAGIVDADILIVGGSAVDLTGAGALTPVTDPSAVLAIEAAAIVPLSPQTETAELIYSWAVRSQLVHQPTGGQARNVPVASLLDGGLESSGIAAGPLTSNSFRGIETRVLPSALWVNLETDVFAVKPLVATNLAANLPFAVVIDGAVINNAGWLPSDQGGRCADTPSGWASMIEMAQRARSRVRGIFGAGGRSLSVSVTK